MKCEEQGSSGSKKSADNLISDRDFVKLIDVHVAKAMRCEEKSQRCAAEPSGKELEEALLILSESLLLQQTRQHSSLISLLSVNPTVIEDKAAKGASTSAA